MLGGGGGWLNNKMQIPRFLSISSHAIVNNHNCTIPSFQTNKSSHQAIFSTSNTFPKFNVSPCNLLVGRRSFPYWVPVTFQGHLLLNFRWVKGAISSKTSASVHRITLQKKRPGFPYRKVNAYRDAVGFRGTSDFWTDRVGSITTPWGAKKIQPLMTGNLVMGM